jgi:hypothetical protein
MRLAVIDASPVAGGPVTHTLACAAAELSGASVVRLRTFDLFGRVCSSCTACSRTGRCTRHDAALDDAMGVLGTADALLVGCPGHFHARDARSGALLERLVGAFGNLETARGIDRVRHGSVVRKRAAIVCGAPPLLGVAAMLGMLPSGAAGVWRTLERAETAIVGCAAVGGRWDGPASRVRATASARTIARAIAAPSPSRVARPVLAGARGVAAALLGSVRPA